MNYLAHEFVQVGDEWPFVRSLPPSDPYIVHIAGRDEGTGIDVWYLSRNPPEDDQ